MNFLKRHKKAFISSLVGVCLLAVLLTVGNQYAPSFMEKTVGFVLTPIQGAFTAVGDWVGQRIDFFVHMGELSAENVRLQAQNEMYSAEISRMKLIDQENERLSALLEIDRKYGYPTMGAKIIAKDVGNWYNTFTIDKGSNDGLAKNMVVLASGGLCGRISEVWYSSATVVAMIDDRSSISAQGSRTGDTGIVRGDANLQLEGKCRMDLISMEAGIMEGDEIVTSQISSIYPSGITIGTVLSVSPGTNGTQSAIIKPTADFRHMSNVLVITELFEHNIQSTSEVLKETADKHAELNLKSADVIGHRATVYGGFLINRGAKHGVAVGDVVLAIGGLAGRVTDTGLDYAEVTSFLDSATPISVRNQDGALGVLRYDAELMAKGCAVLEFTDSEARVQMEDEIVTAEMAGGLYPAGVTVGYISEIQPLADGKQRVIVRAAVNFETAASVLWVSKDVAQPVE